MDPNSHYYREILAHKQDGGTLACALYRLGKHCSILELLAMGIESLNTELFDGQFHKL
jgi:hypothetical protein